MKLFNKIITAAAVTVVSLATATLGFVGSASAACIQYDPNGFNTPTTPVFNNICGVPNIGNESDFVRIRQNSNGDDKDNQNNPNFTVGSLAAVCNNGDKFDVWNYIHNDATQDANNNGNGTAVAHNVALHMTATLDTPGTSFPFTSTITANNAASVTDTATLNCGNNKQVKLTLTQSSVHVYSQQYGWHDLAGNAVNGTTPIGSPVVGSGNQWGCWDYRVIVVYQVTVQEIPQTPPSLGTCKVVDFTVDDKARKVTVNSVTPDLTNATVVGHKIDWGDGTTSDKETDSHTYAKDGTYKVVVSVQVQFADGHTEWKTTDTNQSGGCVKEVTFAATPEKCTVPGKENFPKNSPQCQPTPTALVNTGPGNIAGIFAAVTVAGAFVHRFILSRRFNV